MTTKTCCYCRKYPSDCQACQRCKYCGCRCKPCGPCGKNRPPRHWCQTCKLCRKICACRRTPAVLNFNPLHSTYFVNKLQRPLGLEIELADIGSLSGESNEEQPSWLRYNFVRDASIQGAQPRELVTSPSVGDQFITGTTWLASLLAANHAQINATCG